MLPSKEVIEAVAAIPSLNNCIDKKEFSNKLRNLPEEQM